MSTHDSWEGSLQYVHRDLILLTQSQLRNIDRLWAELDSHVNEFKQLLDKPSKNEGSRKELLSGMISLLRIYRRVG